MKAIYQKHLYYVTEMEGDHLTIELIDQNNPETISVPLSEVTIDPTDDEIAAACQACFEMYKDPRHRPRPDPNPAINHFL